MRPASTDVELTAQLATAFALHEDALVQGQAYEVERLLDSLRRRRTVH